MRILLVALLMMAAIAPAVAAGPWREAGGGLFAVQMRQRQGGMQQRQPQRNYRGPERPPEQGQRSRGRLTDEERRDLHRDLDRANREIYKGPQR